MTFFKVRENVPLPYVSIKFYFLEHQSTEFIYILMASCHAAFVLLAGTFRVTQKKENRAQMSILRKKNKLLTPAVFPLMG